MAKGVLIAAMDFSKVAEDEFNDWYDTEHIPERQRVPGFLTCQRWIGAENPKHSVATYDLESVSVLQGSGYRAIGGENLSPWSKRVTARTQRLLRFEGDQILPGDRPAPEGAGGDDPGSGGRDRVQRVVRHRARPGTRTCSGRAVGAPLPYHRRRQRPEIRSPLSSYFAGSGR